MIMVLIGIDMIVDVTLKIAFSYKLSKYVSFLPGPLSHCLQGRGEGDKKTAFELHVKARGAISLNLLKNRKTDLKRQINS